MSTKMESMMLKLAVLAGGLILPGMAHACTYQFNYSYNPVASNGGGAAVQVLTQPGCPWSVTEASAWLTITSAKAGYGPAVVNYYVAPNATRTARTGYINGWASVRAGSNPNCDAAIGGRSSGPCVYSAPLYRLTLVEYGR